MLACLCCCMNNWMFPYGELLSSMAQPTFLCVPWACVQHASPSTSSSSEQGHQCRVSSTIESLSVEGLHHVTDKQVKSSSHHLHPTAQSHPPPKHSIKKYAGEVGTSTYLASLVDTWSSIALHCCISHSSSWIPMTCTCTYTCMTWIMARHNQRSLLRNMLA